MRLYLGCGLSGVALACFAACASSARLQARVDQVGRALTEAEAHGAMRCAPRELAIAQSQLEFARLEREQGDSTSAIAHLELADENVRAARLLSAAERCEGPSEANDAKPERAGQLDGSGAPPVARTVGRWRQ
jgi:OOP family OmpA-OmpF porin